MWQYVGTSFHNRRISKQMNAVKKYRSYKIEIHHILVWFNLSTAIDLLSLTAISLYYVMHL